MPTLFVMSVVSGFICSSLFQLILASSRWSQLVPFFNLYECLYIIKECFPYGFLNWEYKINRKHKTIDMKIIDTPYSMFRDSEIGKMTKRKYYFLKKATDFQKVH